MKVVDTLRLAGKVAGGAWLRRRPFLLYLKPTSRCDCRCAVCDRWKEQGRRDEELSTEELGGAIRAFARAGAAVCTLWGGEPFLRDDLPELLGAAKEAGMRTSLCTNCNLLARRAGEVAGLLDVILCSLDGYGELHDELRGRAGLFDRAVKGIEAARRDPGCDVKIWAAIHRRNLGQVERLALLARDLGAGIEFFPISPIAGHNEGIVPSAAELRDAFSLALALKRDGLPVRNPDYALRIMRDGLPFRCNFPAIAVTVDHRGSVYCCEDPAGTPMHRWGAIGDAAPERLAPAGERREVAGRLARCNRCRYPCVVELSGPLARSLPAMLLSRAAPRSSFP